MAPLQEVVRDARIAACGIYTCQPSLWTTHYNCRRPHRTTGPQTAHLQPREATRTGHFLRDSRVLSYRISMRDYEDFMPLAVMREHFWSSDGFATPERTGQGLLDGPELDEAGPSLAAAPGRA